MILLSGSNSSRLDMALAKIARLLGNAPLLIWELGQFQGLTIVDYDPKKKRGGKPQTPGAASFGQKSGVFRKSPS